MSYLVLARKSRPQKFDHVVGQRPVVKTLKNSIIRNRIAHAILFSGVRGVGKTTLARLMAKAINCQAEVTARPCDSCDSCREIAAGNSLDLYEIDGASNRGIQEIRELKEKIRFLPTSAQFRVIIIDEVHMLTTEAFNALLKTLEEPPDHVYFMFATTEIHKIPITILSRCQQYELKKVSATELFDHFNRLTADEGYEIESKALSLIVKEAGGSVRDGLSLLDQMFSFGEKTISLEDVVEVLGLVNREVLLNLTKSLLDGNRQQVFHGLEQIFSFGADIKRFLEDMLDHFRSLLLCRLDGCSQLVDLPEEELVEFQKIAENYSAETIHLKLSLLMAVADELKFASQPRLAVETSFLKIIEASNVVPLSQLLGQIEQLAPHLPKSEDSRYQEDSAGPVAADGSPDPKKKTVEQQPTPDETVQPEPILPEDVEPEVVQTVTEVAVVPEAAVEAPPQGPQESPPSPQIEQDTAPIAGESETSEKEAPTPVTAVEIHPHQRDVRKDWPDFIEYVKDRKLWMAKDLARADSFKEENGNELHLTFSEGANCSLLRQKENMELLNEFALDFFQKTLKVRITVPDLDDKSVQNGEASPQRKRMQLANDPLVIMAAEIFNGEVGDIRIGPRSR